MNQLRNIPLLNNIWSNIRKRKIINKHNEVAEFWEPILLKYRSNDLEKYNFSPKKNLGTNKVIWQYWGQGEQNLPEVVQLCFDSVEKYKGDYMVIRLNDDNITDYIDLPDFVSEKVNVGIFGRTFFSDLLRLALLHTYGGVWLDATILLTSTISSKYKELDFFAFQRSDLELNKKFWENSYAYYWGWDYSFRVRLLNSIMFADRGNLTIGAMLDLILYYWKTQNRIIDYFFFQILYTELLRLNIISPCKIIESDVEPHLLQTKFNGQLEDVSYEEVLEKVNIHKMSYFDQEGILRMKRFLEEFNSDINNGR